MLDDEKIQYGYCDSDDEDDEDDGDGQYNMCEFSPLNADLSYSITELPPALELLRTEDIIHQHKDHPHYHCKYQQQQQQQQQQHLQLNSKDQTLSSNQNTTSSYEDSNAGLSVNNDSRDSSDGAIANHVERRSGRVRGKRRGKYGGPADSVSHKPRHVRASGKNVTKKHAQYALTAGMMLGIRECVGGASTLLQEVQDEEHPDDFLHNHYYNYSDTEDDDNNDFDPSIRTSYSLNTSANSNNANINNNSNTSTTHNNNNSGSGITVVGSIISDESLAAAKADQAVKKVRKKLLKKECNKVEKYIFPKGQHCITAQPNKPLPYDYKFKAYAPRIFARIRKSFGVAKQPFLHSICGKFNFIEFMSNAKSGQFFFYSHDGQYMIKTQTQDECKFLRYILPRYYTYLMNNPHTFLTHYYGMYRVKMPADGTSLHFVIMKSVFNTEREIHKIWDLKGSTKGRRAKRGDTVHKDLDIMDEGRKLNVGSQKKIHIMAQLKKDSTFLARLGIMDYSLLVGVHHRLDNDNTVNTTNNYNNNTHQTNNDNFKTASLTDDNDETATSNDSSLPILKLTADNLQQQQQQMTMSPKNNHKANTKLKPPIPNENKRPIMMRTNTPLRRQCLKRADELKNDPKYDFDNVLLSQSAIVNNNYNDSNLTTISNDDDSLSSEESYFEPLTVDDSKSNTKSSKTESTKTSTTTTGTNSKESEMTLIWRDASHAGSILTTSSTYEEKFLVPNPYTSREDLGIESDSLNKLTREIYFMGIIDILQRYDTRKWGETVIKKAAGNTDSEISCVDPETYASRFADFMNALIE